MRRATVLWVLLATSGVMLVAGVTLAASTQSIGLSSEPLSAGDDLAPQETATPAPSETATPAAKRGARRREKRATPTRRARARTTTARDRVAKTTTAAAAGAAGAAATTTIDRALKSPST